MAVLMGAQHSTTKANTNLCEACGVIFKRRRVDKALGAPAPKTLHQSLRDVSLAARQCCHLCHLKLDLLTDAAKKNLDGCERIRYGFRESKVGDGVAFDYYYPRPQPGSEEYLQKSVVMKDATGKQKGQRAFLAFGMR